VGNDFINHNRLIFGASTKSEATIEHGLHGSALIKESVKIRLIGVIRVLFHRSTGSLRLPAQEAIMGTTAKNAKVAKIDGLIL
jgi:hypothetical protein